MFCGRYALLPIFSLASLILSLSCSSTRQLSLSSPDTVLRRFLSYPLPISYASRSKLWINLRTGQKGRTELQVYSNRFQEYSFFLKDLWGKDLMRALIWKDSILVFYPHENQFIRENLANFTQSDYWFWPVSPLDLLKIIDGTQFLVLEGMDFSGFADKLYKFRAKREEASIVLSLSPKDASLRKATLLNEKSEELANIIWQDVRLYKGFYRPRLIDIKLDNSGDEIKIGVLEETFDLNLPDRYFRLSLPPSATQIPLY